MTVKAGHHHKTYGLAGGLLALLLWNGACSEEGKQAVQRTSHGNKSDNLTQGKGDGKDGPDDTGTGPGAAFFAATVVPQFKKDCVSCHADPSSGVETPGPLTIFSHDALIEDLVTGTGPTDNNLMAKVTGVSAHTGGNRCPEGVNTPACQVIAAWYAVEKPPVNRDEDATYTGELNVVSSTGQVSGWAADPNSMADAVNVAFFIDVADSGGTPAFELKAEKDAYDNGTSGSHAFSDYIPEAKRDGKQHMLYAYAAGVGQMVALKGSPQAFTAYKPNAAGKAYFDATLKTMLTNRCGGCHAVAYETQWASLLTPAPSKGGTATNNLLNQKPSAAVSHGGGNVCGGANGGPCAQIQEWWRREFGAL